jgi:hypothetical protein
LVFTKDKATIVKNEINDLFEDLVDKNIAIEKLNKLKIELEIPDDFYTLFLKYIDKNWSNIRVYDVSNDQIKNKTTIIIRKIITENNFTTIKLILDNDEIKKLSIDDDLINEIVNELEEKGEIFVDSASNKIYDMKKYYTVKEIEETSEQEIEREITSIDKVKIITVEEFEKIYSPFYFDKGIVVENKEFKASSLIWGQFQIEEINLLVKEIRSKQLINDTELSKNFAILVSNLISNKYHNYSEFYQLLTNLFGKTIENNREEYKSKEPFVTSKVSFSGKITSHLEIFSLRIRMIIFGGKRRSSEEYLPPILTNEWELEANNLIKKIYNRLMFQYFRSIVEYDIKIIKDIKNIDLPYKHLLQLPILNFSTIDVSWSLVDDSFHDGHYMFKTIGNNQVSYGIAIHQWLMFWSMRYGWTELIESIVHHEIVHMIQDRYARLYDAIEFEQEKEDNSIYENKIKPNFDKYYKPALATWIVKANDPIKKIWGEGEDAGKTFKELYDEILSGKKNGVAKPSNMREFLQLYEGHDYAFVFEAKKYGSNGNCAKAIQQRKNMNKIFNILYHKRKGKNFQALGVITCEPLDPVLEGNFRNTNFA